jgi:hypothetical protein
MLEEVHKMMMMPATMVMNSNPQQHPGLMAALAGGSGAPPSAEIVDDEVDVSTPRTLPSLRQQRRIRARINHDDKDDEVGGKKAAAPKTAPKPSKKRAPKKTAAPATEESPYRKKYKSHATTSMFGRRVDVDVLDDDTEGGDRPDGHQLAPGLSLPDHALFGAEYGGMGSPMHNSHMTSPFGDSSFMSPSLMTPLSPSFVPSDGQRSARATRGGASKRGSLFGAQPLPSVPTSVMSMGDVEMFGFNGLNGLFSPALNKGARTAEANERSNPALTLTEDAFQQFMTNGGTFNFGMPPTPATPGRLEDAVPLTPMSMVSPTSLASMIDGPSTRSKRHGPNELSAAGALHGLSSPVPAVPAKSARRGLGMSDAAPTPAPTPVSTAASAGISAAGGSANGQAARPPLAVTMTDVPAQPAFSAPAVPPLTSGLFSPPPKVERRSKRTQSVSGQGATGFASFLGSPGFNANYLASPALGRPDDVMSPSRFMNFNPKNGSVFSPLLSVGGVTSLDESMASVSTHASSVTMNDSNMTEMSFTGVPGATPTSDVPVKEKEVCCVVLCCRCGVSVNSRPFGLCLCQKTARFDFSNVVSPTGNLSSHPSILKRKLNAATPKPSPQPLSTTAV